jgi:hypothetical protein
MSASGPSRVIRALILLFLAALPAAAQAQVTVVVGGNHNTAIKSALDQIGITYTTATGVMLVNPSTYNLGKGDIIIISNDGGTPESVDYTNFLNAGGHVIAVGGSSLTQYYDWVGNYFNLTDGQSWHTDGDWVKTATHAASAGLPDTYTFGNSSATYHMLAFTATTNTVLYGRNTEPNYIAAIRTYNNGGTFNYMALDIGRNDYLTTNDFNSFTLPWMRASLSAVPEPSTYALFGTGLAVLGLRAWRRRPSR